MWSTLSQIGKTMRHYPDLMCSIFFNYPHVLGTGHDVFGRPGNGDIYLGYNQTESSGFRQNRDSYCKNEVNHRQTRVRTPSTRGDDYRVAFFWRVKSSPQYSGRRQRRAKGDLLRSIFPNEAMSRILQPAKGKPPRFKLDRCDQI